MLKQDLDKRRPSVERLLDDTQELLAKNKYIMNDSQGLLTQVSPSKDGKRVAGRSSKDRMSNGDLESFAKKTGSVKSGISFEGTSKPSNQQQVQRLRRNAADLKVRFDGVSILKNCFYGIYLFF